MTRRRRQKEASNEAASATTGASSSGLQQQQQQQQQQQPAEEGAASSSNGGSRRRRRQRRQGRSKQQPQQQQESSSTNQQNEQGDGGGADNNNKSSSSNSNNKPQRRQRQRQGRNQNQKKKNQQQQQQSNPNNNNNNQTSTKLPYPPHLSLEECLQAYHHSNNNENADKPVMMIRGTLRVLPFSNNKAAATASFVTCDRGLYSTDICILTEYDRNRAMDGDVVFCEILPENDDQEQSDKEEEDVSERNDTNDDDDKEEEEQQQLEQDLEEMTLQDEKIDNEEEEEEHEETWQDDPIQASLWNPIVSIPRPKPRSIAQLQSQQQQQQPKQQQQRKGRVVYIYPPKPVHSEIGNNNSNTTNQCPTRRIVGTLKRLHNNNKNNNSDNTITTPTILLTPNNRSLPQFKCPAAATTTQQLIDQLIAEHQQEQENTATAGANNNNNNARPASTKVVNDVDAMLEQVYVSAEYVPGSWQASHKWPPCTGVQQLGTAAVLEDEVQALLMEHAVNHGDFPAAVLQDVHQAVQRTSGGGGGSTGNDDDEWKPARAMYQNRRDYRSARRIFTIDPTTAKDLDDALHCCLLPDGETVELGVHIADVSAFVQPGTAVDVEAQRRSTTVYLVDRTVPMLPRPLCEVACSLNENVERLAFSCVWNMKLDGTLLLTDDDDPVWYGRTVIQSCARLDYATAQNIIDGKVATGESDDDDDDIDEDLWPTSRRPTRYSVNDVAADVRLMHRVAMARRRLRFEQGGALALHGIKLTFQLDQDGQTPLLTAPYPIRDSNRLVEEFMLLANYLVAQRLITHAAGRAVLRCHKEPQLAGLENLAMVAKAAGNYEIDVSSSQSLHQSLVRLGRECNDPLVLQCLTQMLMTPMVPAEYFAAGAVEPPLLWRHFALNIPYYTHFTSPIRRYPDVMVHRLLQATIDGPEAVDQFYADYKEIQSTCNHCNEKRMASKKAQERCDRVFLSLYVKAHPIEKQLGVVLSVGKSTFTVFVSSLGVNSILYLDEHKDMLTFASDEDARGTRRILLQQKENPKKQQAATNKWGTLEIKIFTKLQVTVLCRDKPPVDVRLRLEGPWRE